MTNCEACGAPAAEGHQCGAPAEGAEGAAPAAPEMPAA